MNAKEISYFGGTTGFLVGALSSFLGKPQWGPCVGAASCLLLSAINSNNYSVAIVCGYIAGLVGAEVELKIKKL
jgi:hypothetical protein